MLALMTRESSDLSGSQTVPLLSKVPRSAQTLSNGLILLLAVDGVSVRDSTLQSGLCSLQYLDCCGRLRFDENSMPMADQHKSIVMLSAQVSSSAQKTSSKLPFGALNENKSRLTDATGARLSLEMQSGRR